MKKHYIDIFVAIEVCGSRSAKVIHNSSILQQSCVRIAASTNLRVFATRLIIAHFYMYTTAIGVEVEYVGQKGTEIADYCKKDTAHYVRWATSNRECLGTNNFKSRISKR